MQSRIHELINGKAGEIYKKMVASKGYDSPHEFLGITYNSYKETYGSNKKNINGSIFEYLICETLAQQGIVPFYYQAKFERVPNVEFDIVLYNSNKPVVFTMKTSLRERYKQADLEGMALRQVYRQADIYLITMSRDEAGRVSQKIKNGAVMGLSQCVVASSAEYDDLLKKVKRRRFSRATSVKPVEGRFLYRASETRPTAVK